MSRYLLLDIGAGTLDILYYDDETHLPYKAVVISPARHLAARVEALEGALLVTGSEMGGSPISAVLKRKAATGQVLISSAAAATIHHDPARVAAAGLRIVDDNLIEHISVDPRYRQVVLGDLDPDRIKSLIQAIGVPFEFDVLAICAQDHGVAPPGVSHLDYRHRLFCQRLDYQLDKRPRPQSLLYAADEIPETMNRLASIAADAGAIPADRLYLMDSGMAAIIGASLDPATRHHRCKLVLDIATSHTVGAALCNDELYGFFEYHTHDLTPERLKSLLIDLADGKLEHGQVLKQGGHGAYMRNSFGFDVVESIVATGPKRRLVKEMDLPVYFGAPMGDNMMTGNLGLLNAVREREGDSAIDLL